MSRAHQKSEEKKKKTKKRNIPKHHQKVVAQPDGPEVQTERGYNEEAGVTQDLLKSPGLQKESCLAHPPLGGVKRRRKRKTKEETDTKENDQQVRRKKGKMRKRRENPRVMKM